MSQSDFGNASQYMKTSIKGLVTTYDGTKLILRKPKKRVFIEKFKTNVKKVSAFKQIYNPSPYMNVDPLF